MTKKTKSVFIAVLLLLASGYIASAWYVMRTDIAVPILAIVTNDSYPGIPQGLAKAYLVASNYDPNAHIRLGMPAYNFIVAGYGQGNSFQNDSVLQLSQQFIDKGADINRPWYGFTPLQAAILAREPILIQHLLQNGADPNTRVNSPGKPYNKMTTQEFAEYLASSGKQDMSEVLAALNNGLTHPSRGTR